MNEISKREYFSQEEPEKAQIKAEKKEPEELSEQDEFKNIEFEVHGEGPRDIIKYPHPPEQKLYERELFLKSKRGTDINKIIENLRRETSKKREENLREHLTREVFSKFSDYDAEEIQTWPEYREKFEALDLKALEFILLNSELPRIRNFDLAPGSLEIWLQKYNGDHKKFLEGVRSIVQNIEAVYSLVIPQHPIENVGRINEVCWDAVLNYIEQDKDNKERLVTKLELTSSLWWGGLTSSLSENDEKDYVNTRLIGISKVLRRHFPQEKDFFREYYLELLTKLESWREPWNTFQDSDLLYHKGPEAWMYKGIPLKKEREYNIYFAFFYIESILKELAEIGDRDTIDKLIAFVEKASAANIAPVADCISKIDANYGAQRLLEVMRKTQDPYMKRVAAKMLCRMELGRIGISEEGVRYLDKVFDLAEYNNPDFFVQRLTSEGDIGIFDEKTQKLLKYFKLKGLDSPQAKIKAQVLDFVFETFFTPRADETPEQRKQKENYIEELKEHYFEIIKDALFEETGMRFNNLSFKEQGWFLQLLFRADNQTKKRLETFVEKYGEFGIKAFTAMEYDEENYLKILEIGERFEEERAKRIFLEYWQIYDLSDGIREIFKESLKAGKPPLPENIVKAFPQQVQEAFIRRSQDVLLGALATLEEKGEAVSKKDILYSLYGIRRLLELVGASLLSEKKKPKYEIFNRSGQPLPSPEKRGHQSYFLELRDKDSGQTYILKILIRPRATEKGEARIQFEVRFNTDRPNLILKEAFTSERTDKRTNRKTRSSRLRASLDLDRFYNRISLDLGSSPYKSEKFSREGDIVGKILALRNKYYGSHNPLSFDEAISQPENFAAVAQNFNAYLRKRLW